MLKGALAYFALVFGTGFVFGAIRVPFLVPRIGARYAELLEMPFMACAIYFAARYVVRRFALDVPSAQLGAGTLALVLLVAAELHLAVLLQDRSIAEYVASRDPVSGGVYLAMLVFFALAPWLVARFGRRG